MGVHMTICVGWVCRRPFNTSIHLVNSPVSYAIWMRGRAKGARIGLVGRLIRIRQVVAAWAQLNVAKCGAYRRYQCYQSRNDKTCHILVTSRINNGPDNGSREYHSGGRYHLSSRRV
jgi:hypothetical protein